MAYALEHPASAGPLMFQHPATAMHFTTASTTRLQRLALATSLCALLAACGGGDGTPAASASAGPAPVPAPAPAPAASAPAPAPAPAPAGWGSVTVSGAGLAADRAVTPNLLPDFGMVNTSAGPARSLAMRRSTDPLHGDAGIDQINVRFVATTGVVLSASVALVPDPTQPVGTASYAATCAPCSGITVDLAAGTVSFAATALQATALSGNAAAATLNGSYTLPDYRPRAGTTATAAALAACSVNSVAVSAAFSDMACLAGTYVGTGVDGQACTVQIDATAQSFRFDDGIRNNSFGYTVSGGFSNLSTFRSAFTQSAQMTQPNVPLEWISLQATPVAGFSQLIQVDLQTMQAVGGTQNAAYKRDCRIEFDRSAP